MADVEMETVTLRGFGYSVQHGASVPPEAVDVYQWIGPPFEGVSTPVVALCGRQVRSHQPVAVVMPGAPTCRECQRAT